METLRPHLVHPITALLPDELYRRAREQGFSDSGARSAEALAWDYELHAQVQIEAADSFRLKGGAATQLHVPKQWQRSSVDIDLLTVNSPAQVERILAGISKRIRHPIYFNFDRYRPAEPREGLTLDTFLTNVPRSPLRGEVGYQPRVLKIDVHYTSELPAAVRRTVDPFIVDLQYNPDCVPRSYLVAEKLLTQALDTVGVPVERRPEDIPKHLYDLSALTSMSVSGEDFSAMNSQLPLLIKDQGPEWRGSNAFTTVKRDLDESLLR